MKKTIAIIAAGSLALALSACGGPKTDEAPVETNVMNVEEADNAILANVGIEVPAPATNVATGPAPKGPDFADEAQTRDDADATGMTARVSRDGDNETAPAK